jgi:hypothetical protein
MQQLLGNSLLFGRSCVEYAKLRQSFYNWRTSAMALERETRRETVIRQGLAILERAQVVVTEAEWRRAIELVEHVCGASVEAMMDELRASRAADEERQFQDRVRLSQMRRIRETLLRAGSRAEAEEDHQDAS